MTVSTKFADAGPTVKVLSFDDEMIKDYLKAGVYQVEFDPMQGFFLSKYSERMGEPDRVYGSIDRRVKKTVETYEEAEGSLGVLFSGAKGSGKSMTSAIICNQMIDKGFPVVLVGQKFDPDGLASFIAQLGECVIFFDEFGKMYNTKNDEQGALLSVFDGTSSDKRLILLTENEQRDINGFMLNRPGRVYYHFRHDKVETSVIEEYCADMGVDDEAIGQIILLQQQCFDFSFDVLQSLVREYNKYGGDIKELAAELNIEQPRQYSDVKLRIDAIVDATSEKTYNMFARRHPSKTIDFPEPYNDSEVVIEVFDEDGEREVRCLEISIRDIVDQNGDVYQFGVDDARMQVMIKGTAVYDRPPFSLGAY